MWGDIAIAFLLAFITAYVVTPYTIRFAKKIGALDMPKKRKIHSTPMPRLGGIAVIAGFIVSTIYLLTVMSIEKTLVLTGPDNYQIKILGFFAGIVVLGIFCFFDDWKNISPLVKLLGQIIAATIVAYCGIRIDKIVLHNLNTIINNNKLSNIHIYIIYSYI